ncbi:hypothetical protein GN244_ATG14465 [Phytophthora infestans]|uniref:Uncharacterized protein n=1 Tax=Phytophthora infestans TaxID=4787 RepID=A0A833SXX5_PHYIN|nr:hypothetical protein GN244_ATG14465 [Phytophthora infestans]
MVVLVRSLRLLPVLWINCFLWPAITETDYNTIGEFGLTNTFSSRRAAERSLFTALDQQSSKLAFDVMGDSAIFKPYRNPKSMWLLLKCPMQKNTRGFIYLNYNSSSTTLVTTGSTGAVAPASIASLSNSMNFGSTCPVLWNLSSGATTTALARGLALPASAVSLKITADVSGTPTAETGITPSQSFSRLLVTTYSPNPSADLAPGASFTWTVSNGIANQKRLIMQRVITNPTAGATVLDLINPFRSPFSTVPATTSPFAALKNLQGTEGNVPIWSNPISFGYYLFVQEMSKSGVDGGLDGVTSAGLLSQRQWESLYRFVAVDIGRRLPSENGANKSIIVSGTSSCNYALTIYSHVLREVVATVDTAIGTVSQGPVQGRF